MKRLPVLMLFGLVVMWLLLTGSVTPGQVVLGTLLALLMVLGFRAIRPVQPRVSHPLSILRLLGRVLTDIVRSNVAVGRIVLGLTGGRSVHSGFVRIPLDMRDPHGLAALAAIVTSTPGTVWVDLTPDGSTLTLHVLDLQDEKAWIRTVKQRYERLLMEIFE